MIDIRKIELVPLHDGFTVEVHYPKDKNGEWPESRHMAFTNAADMLKALQAIVEPDADRKARTYEELLDQIRQANRVKHDIDQVEYASSPDKTGPGPYEPDDGWRVWEGSLEGQRPVGVKADDLVEIKLRVPWGGGGAPSLADKCDWKHGPRPYDIVAYRVVKP